MAMQMPPPSPRTEKRRLAGAAEQLEVLASPSKRGAPTPRSFFSTGPDPPRTPADVSWIREQAGGTPRTLDREFLEPNSSGGQNNGNARTPASSNNTSVSSNNTSASSNNMPVSSNNTPAPSNSTPASSNNTSASSNNTSASSNTNSGTTASGGRGKTYNRRTWTKEENEQLQQGISSLGIPEGDLGKHEWNAIASDFLKNSRTGTQCATHWKMVLKPALLKGVWSAEEDSIIYESVARGVTDWNEVASLLPKRKAKHCRERWNNHLDPTLSKVGWTVAEEATLLSAVEAHGTSWTQIARLLPGRSEAAIQQHWNTIVFRNATSTGGVRRGRSRADVTVGSSSTYANRGKVKPSGLPTEILPQAPVVRDGGMSVSGRVDSRRNGGRSGAATFLPVEPTSASGATLTEREKALMDHAFKTGLNAAAGGGVGVAPPEVIDAIAKGDGMEQLTLTTEDDDVFAPLSAALLRDGSEVGCSPEMPPPSPTASPLLKPRKRASDCSFLGQDLADGWGADEDPALADLYRSLDNIGESLFNEDNFELTFDFDSVDKPSAASASNGALARSPGMGHRRSCSAGSPPSWINQVPGGQGHKDVSPFRRAAAQAAATLGKQRVSPVTQKQGGRDLQVASERTAGTVRTTVQRGQNVGTANVSAPAPGAADPGPRVKQGLLRRLFSDMNSDKLTRPSSSYPPFATVRGCLSEANASPTTLMCVGGVGGVGGVWAFGGENRAPVRVQSLSSALFALPPPSVFMRGGDGNAAVVTPTLKHGKVEVQVPRPDTLASASTGVGVGLSPLSVLPASRFNSNQEDSDYRWEANEPVEQA